MDKFMPSFDISRNDNPPNVSRNDTPFEIL